MEEQPKETSKYPIGCCEIEENGADHEISMERSSDLLTTNCSDTEEPDAQVFQHLACVSSSDPSFGQNECSTVLPITVHVADGSSPVQNASVHLSQTQPLSEQFHVIDQNGQAIQYELQSLAGSNTQMMIVASQSENGQVLHVIPSSQPGMAQVLIPQGQLLDVASASDPSEEKQNDVNLETVAVATVTDNTSSYVLHSQASVTLPIKTTTRVVDDLFPIPIQPLSPNTPVWARRLRNCERIGDSYRGYCVSEAELESVLTVHKQQTQSVWGTRQSPSPAKPATRLMWKSQYVPYDGIPFVNAGSRAIVMECQYGPRRKGTQPKKSNEQESTSSQMYKATCPARIYIKKVQKFPEYRVPTDPKIDKKIIRMEQEKAFNMLKKNLIEAGGVIRWYVQLPNQQAHQYHDLEPPCLPPSPSHFSLPPLEEEEDAARDESALPSRLHPQVADKIRELVSQGIEQVYAVRKQLRKFVEQELFKPDEVPERHNLSYFPTVNDIKNHIHEVQKALRTGDLVYDSETIPATLQWTMDSGNVLTETVTVTFASPPTEGTSPGSVIAKVESSQAGEPLSPAQLLSSLSSLQPKIFAQLQILKRVFWEIRVMCKVCKMFRHGLKGFREYAIVEPRSSRSEKEVFYVENDRFPGKALRVTMKRPEWRTEEDMKLLRSFLQVLPSYHHYSSHLQFLLAKVIRYESFGRSRVIVKKGQPGNSFYFLYSGCVAVTMDEDGSSAFVDEEPVLLHRGSGFGEIALLKGLNRNATIVCMEETELLVVDKQDFFDNKLDVELQKECLYRYHVLRKLDLFASWPEPLIERISERCKAEKFHHGQVIIWDTSETNSVTFVSKGCCELLRLVDLTACPSYHKWLSQQPDIPIPIQTYKPNPISRKRFEGIMLNFRSLEASVHKGACITPFYSKQDPQRRNTTTSFRRDSKKPTISTRYGEIPSQLAASVYFRINILHAGDCLSFSQIVVSEKAKDTRSMVLVSNGAEVIRVDKDKFIESADTITIKKLSKLERTYPSDDQLCQIFLEENRWKLFKTDLVKLIVDPYAEKLARPDKEKHKPFIQTTLTLNNAGILDLSSASKHYFPDTSKKEFKIVPVSKKSRYSYATLPYLQPRLIHSIAVRRPSLKILLQ
ncbi:calcium-responsive transcription factor isoform X2 [Rhinatrema bivittatum]|uniref:calcium-responsive transcription factor isoform X2 n=1 Tax=Rhinatrema bivittatum TaxID=194408 RepID=UPI001128E81D|nr:calcium-responsive transcription factor isoform X2 [Rhinatrema bivittatum]